MLYYIFYRFLIHRIMVIILLVYYMDMINTVHWD